MLMATNCNNQQKQHFKGGSEYLIKLNANAVKSTIKDLINNQVYYVSPIHSDDWYIHAIPASLT